MKSPDRGRTHPEPKRKSANSGTTHRTEKSAPPTRTGRSRSGRESIESFVVVFVSFLLWSLEAEGFVIPTGSMAPTLMGRHKEIDCPECGYTFTVNADREVDSSGRGTSTGRRVDAGTCENCRFEANVSDAPSFSGDRIYVMKNGLSLPFLPAENRVKLKRWDVAVFKLPEEPEVRYIKRMVGVPNEIIRIEAGDLWRQPLDHSTEFARLRRSPDHQQAMQMMVYDDAHRAVSLENDPRWRRWVSNQKDAWAQNTSGVYSTSADAADWVELQYKNMVPSPDQWAAIRHSEPPRTPPAPTLVTDYYSYNSDLAEDDRTHPRSAAKAWYQPHWVGDLTVSLRLHVRKPSGEVRVELIKGGVSNRCEISLANGTARLFHGESAVGEAARTSINQNGTYDVIFANVDGRLTLWVDGKLPFGEGIVYPSLDEPARPTTADLAPARVAARQADVEVDRLVLKRDVYYTREPAEHDFIDLDNLVRLDSSALFDLLADPARFALLVRPTPHDYPLGPGRYLMLGDNSPWSRDGRAWSIADQISPDLPGHGWDSSGRESWEVPEDLLIGKAFCVYWPHAKPIWPRFHMNADWRLPSVPYFERMRWIR